MIGDDIQALWVTLKLAFATSCILLVIATPIAWWLATKRTGLTAIIEAAVAMPLILPPTVLGFYLLIIMNPNTVFGSLWVSLTGETLLFSFWGLVFGSVIYSLPFAVQPLQSGFRSIPTSILDSATLMGMSKWTRFHQVVFPASTRSYYVAATLTFAHTIGEFGVVLMIGGSIPTETRVLSIAVYEHVESIDYLAAHRVSLILVVFTMFILVPIYRLAGNTDDEAPLRWTRS